MLTCPCLALRPQTGPGPAATSVAALTARMTSCEKCAFYGCGALSVVWPASSIPPVYVAAALAAGTRLIEATLRALRLVELCGGKKLSRVQAATLRKATQALEAEPRIIDW